MHNTMSFSEEISTSGAIAQGGASAVFIAFFQDTLQIMIPYLIVTFAIVVLDCIYGIKASIKRGEHIRPARAIRRTVSKLFEYICWIIVAATLSLAVKWGPLQYIILSIPIGIELLSIMQNFLFIKGKRIQGLNIFKIVGEKIGTDLSDVKIEDVEEEEKKN